MPLMLPFLGEHTTHAMHKDPPLMDLNEDVLRLVIANLDQKSSTHRSLSKEALSGL